ncbi:DUF3604 domain-containing protein [Shimia sagamensis]|uniref:DUF3604 domain-containing protein n=1 Tax=Shimia sagamensis TaxID=1566352 RepID=A0ABY1PN30_9RHOB|nr:DUF3604 domain-containing protein [Shimia sagamensis]SMP36643.1 Protein of unknown function [Shimia sagamensis]
MAGAGFAQSYVGDLAINPEDVRLGQQHFSPFVDQAFPNKVFWGDTHLHTSYSTDAGMLGNTLGPDEAFRFARGEKVRGSLGEYAQLVRPLDFLVVADHAENLGLAPMISEANPQLLANPWGREVYQLTKDGNPLAAYVQWGESMMANVDPLDDGDLTRTFYNRIVEAAEHHNLPGVFTAIHGFEWTSSRDANNLHRVVMFRDNADKVADIIPFSNYDSSDPEDLWDWMEAYEARTGGRVMAMPHNGNLSNGLMFNDVRENGEPIDVEYAERRMRWEPLYEVTQIKGDGETHPMLSPNDEFSDYYTWDRGNFGTELKTPEMLPREYARTTLARGLKFEQEIGVNPFKFGMIGSTDSHTSLATAREDNYFGKAALGEPGGGQERYDEYLVQPDFMGEAITVRHYETLAAGLAAAWARENTREAIWDAFKRKEVYATTGPRMTVRVFAGWDFEADEVHRPDFATEGYARGVPMGADLFAGPEGGAPTLMIRALRDPDGANLDRIQVIKGWVDAAGDPQNKVFNVVWAGERETDAEGNLPVIGNTVDGAEYTNTIGTAALGGHWVDPQFDPAQRAYYYVRVLEIPTPSWLAYDEAHFGSLDLPEDAVMEQQERAYTSPIWYSPKD